MALPVPVTCSKPKLNNPVVHSETLRVACDQLLDMYVEEEYGAMAIEMGRLLRCGNLETLGVFNGQPLHLLCEDKPVDEPEFDIFGEPVGKKCAFTCECPKCHRRVSASRFSKHLERCMGLEELVDAVPERQQSPPLHRRRLPLPQPQPVTQTPAALQHRLNQEAKPRQVTRKSGSQNST